MAAVLFTRIASETVVTPLNQRFKKSRTKLRVRRCAWAIPYVSIYTLMITPTCIVVNKFILAGTNIERM